MGGNGSKDEPGKDDLGTAAPDTAADKVKAPRPRPADLDDDEDGDIATPKRDRTGDDDEPL